MTKKALEWAPVINLPAGNCLTVSNWEQTGVSCMSVHLAPLLMKPGEDYLQKIPNIRTLYPWAGFLVLNADMPKPPRDGRYHFRSIYDGSLLGIDSLTLLKLIIQLKPDAAILPSGGLEAVTQLSETEIQVLPPRIYVRTGLQGPLPTLPGGLIKRGTTIGPSLDLRTEADMGAFLQTQNGPLHGSPGPLHILGNLSFDSYNKLAYFPPHCLYESNRAAEDGATGIIYQGDTTISILEATIQNTHRPIDAQCECATCKAKLSCAYLHHLFLHTPLLAKRYLIQHNLVKIQKHRLPADKIPI